MQEKTTSELEKELSSCADLTTFLKENEEVFKIQSVSDSLRQILEEKALNKSAVIKKSGLNDIYAYQIFSGARIPSRDKLLCLCFGMELDAEETQWLLKSCGYTELYAKSKRDSVILHALYHKKDILELNEELFENKEKLIN